MVTLFSASFSKTVGRESRLKDWCVYYWGLQTLVDLTCPNLEKLPAGFEVDDDSGSLVLFLVTRWELMQMLEDTTADVFGGHSVEVQVLYLVLRLKHLSANSLSTESTALSRVSMKAYYTCLHVFLVQMCNDV